MNKRSDTRKRLVPATIHSTEGGKLPPQAVELEEAVLGAILLEKEAYHEVAHILLPEAFYHEKHMRICQAIINLYNRGEAADILTVTQELKRTGELEFIGGAYYVSAITQRIASSANIEFHMRIILQEWIKREIILNSTVTIRDAYEPSVDSIDLLDSWEKSLMEMQQKLFIAKTNDSTSLYDQVLADNEILTSHEGAIMGITTGFTDLDILTGGWQKTDMIVLAARPGMGKTGLVLCFAAAAAKSGKPVAIFSMEMSASQLYKRLASQETEIPLDMILRQGMDTDTVATFKRDTEALRKAPLFIDDTAALTMPELRRKARKLKREENIEMIAIDYLQLMGDVEDGGNREQEVSKISRGIKALAKELEIPIIALAQLSRQTENRPGGSKRPQLSDLRDSGAIEQDADMVMFIYRAEYYGMTQDEAGNSTRGLADILISKNRHGPLDTVTLRWLGQYTKFVDLRETRQSPGTQFPAKSLPPNNSFTEEKNDKPF